MDSTSTDNNENVWIALIFILLTALIIYLVHNNMETSDRRKAVFQKIAEMLGLSFLSSSILGNYYHGIGGIISDHKVKIGLLSKGSETKTTYSYFSIELNTPSFEFKLIHKDVYSSIQAFFDVDYYVNFETETLPPNLLIKTNDPSILKMIETKIFDSPIIHQIQLHNGTLILQDNTLTFESKKIIDTEADIPFVMEMVEALGKIIIQIEGVKS